MKECEVAFMVCEECKKCFNYLVCETGCYGSTEPCEYMEQDYQDFCETLESVKREDKVVVKVQ
ncbi:hypothetical protein N4T77_16995 [Clostridium sp. CX1]|uniref:hypothetical protein n=1 Tax=Clostridium sp. CX1 TaxID=2978346 RepID=UPI0021C004D0|nr:hypothetical protein [Clostridium sp. CX1]MCT8978287.1 hypothetical protein [Clostridium sp. CX1]